MSRSGGFGCEQVVEVPGTRHLQRSARAGGDNGRVSAADWQVLSVEKLGPFYLRVQFRLPSGEQREWSSRRQRLGRDVRHPRQTLLGASRRVVLPGAHWQPWRLSWWMALGYLFGSAVFLGGMGGAKLSLVGTRAASWWYLSAACLFVLANYCSLISTVNGSDDLTEANLRSFRWIGWEPRQLPYLLTLAYLVGSLLFLAHAVVRLTGKAMPDHSLVALSLTLTGSVIFLCGFAVEVREVRRRHVWWDPRNLEWWRAALSFVGCAGFVCGAATGLIKHLLRMSWLSPVSGGAFFAGILLFLVSSYLILPELSG